MKKLFVSILLLAASAALSSCVMDNGGNHNLNDYSLKEYACYLVEHSAIVSVSAISQMVLDKRDINAEGMELFIDTFNIFILRCKAASGCRVNNQDYLPLEILH